MPQIESAGALLRHARRSAGLTQAELARAGGVTQSVVSAYESGRRQPAFTTLLRLLRASGHDLEASLVPREDPSGVSTAPTGPLRRRVQKRWAQVQSIASAHGVSRVRLFGSVARGTETPESDVDLLVALPDGMGLFALGRLRSDLEELLGAPVDLVPEGSLKPEVREGIEAVAW